MDDVVLPETLQQTIGEIDKADIVIGIPSFNNARTIGHVVRAAQAGLAKYFPDKRAVLINADGGSTDGTMDVVKDTMIEDFQSVLITHKSEPFFKISTPYIGLPGKGSAFRTIFAISRDLGAEACAVVDSDLRSITPEWIELLIKPLLNQAHDYVAPLYQRHKYDGTITNSIVYPLTRTLYGKRIRQPIGGDFGFSGNLADHYLKRDVWHTDVARYGIDIWMTTTAVADGFRVCQSYLGAKIHDPKDPGADLSTMLSQVVGAAFDLMETYAGNWKGVGSSEVVPTFGFRYEVGTDPIAINVHGMIEKFTLGVNTLGGIWRSFMAKAHFALLTEIARKAKESIHIPDDLWAGIIYDFAIAAHENKINRGHLLRSLTPLYIGKTASFVMETQDSNPDQVEEKIEALCKAFEDRKSYLMVNWKS